MPECAKAYLQQSRISNYFRGGAPDLPLSGRGEVKGERRLDDGERRKGREGSGGG